MGQRKGLSGMKLPTITIADWLAAEQEARKPDPQPEGSVTAAQYASMIGRAWSRARARLDELVIAGAARKERWYNGRQGITNVYILNKDARQESPSPDRSNGRRKQSA